MSQSQREEPMMHQNHPAAPTATELEHFRPHRHWRTGDRPELRCAGWDGPGRCYLIINHAGRCHG